MESALAVLGEGVTRLSEFASMGSESFTSFIGDFGDRSWVVLFVNADFQSTTTAYAAITGRTLRNDLPVVPGEHGFAPDAAVVELPGSGWTAIFHVIGRWCEFDSVALAKQLATRVIAYEAEDTSGSSDCTSIEPDGTKTRMQEQAVFNADAELYDEMSEYASEMGMEQSSPEPTEIIVDYDTYLRSQGIVLVKLSFNDDSTAAIVSEQEADKVGHVVHLGGVD